MVPELNASSSTISMLIFLLLLIRCLQLPSVF